MYSKQSYIVYFTTQCYYLHMDTDYRVRFWNNLEKVMIEKHVSLNRLAKELGIERTCLSHNKSYKNVPRAERIIEISKILNVPVEVLILV